MQRLALTKNAPAYLMLARALICAAALGALVLSVALWFTGDRQAGLFVGLWVPSILALGAIVLPRGSA